MTHDQASGTGPGKTPTAGTVTPGPALPQSARRYLPKRDEWSVANVLLMIVSARRGGRR